MYLRQQPTQATAVGLDVDGGGDVLAAEPVQRQVETLDFHPRPRLPLTADFPLRDSLTQPRDLKVELIHRERRLFVALQTDAGLRCFAADLIQLVVKLLRTASDPRERRRRAVHRVDHVTYS